MTVASRVPAGLKAISAPNLAKGWLTRLIGRLLKEASPINWLAKELPAKIPSKRRFVVPELPMALTPTAAAASLASNFVSQLT